MEEKIIKKAQVDLQDGVVKWLQTFFFFLLAITAVLELILAVIFFKVRLWGGENDSFRSCQADSDCVLGLDPKQCCECPMAVNKDGYIAKGLVSPFLEIAYKKPLGCQLAVCKPCVDSPKAVCLAGNCTVISGKN